MDDSIDLGPLQRFLDAELSDMSDEPDDIVNDSFLDSDPFDTTDDPTTPPRQDSPEPVTPPSFTRSSSLQLSSSPMATEDPFNPPLESEADFQSYITELDKIYSSIKQYMCLLRKSVHDVYFVYRTLDKFEENALEGRTYDELFRRGECSSTDVALLLKSLKLKQQQLLKNQQLLVDLIAGPTNPWTDDIWTEHKAITITAFKRDIPGMSTGTVLG